MLVTHKKNQGKHTRETNCRERERERKTPDDRLSYIHKNWGGAGMQTKGLLSEVTSEIVCPLNICEGG